MLSYLPLPKNYSKLKYTYENEYYITKVYEKYSSRDCFTAKTEFEDYHSKMTLIKLKEIAKSIRLNTNRKTMKEIADMIIDYKKKIILLVIQKLNTYINRDCIRYIIKIVYMNSNFHTNVITF